ncbi:hypothetical protein NE865_02101 [Phthorimaea operculella]|nr:hypothetical protein NE865_02101 [Phthorimaea operculella]
MRWSIALLALVTCGVNGQNCRGDEQRVRSCERICDENNKCTVRAALLLPANTSYDASLPVVRPVLELALQSQFVKDVFPDWLNFSIQAYDVTNCDAAYAVISAIDAYNDCAHVFFGPACDFALGLGNYINGLKNGIKLFS